MASPPSLDELWQSALEGYGLERPSEETEIHVFRVILKPSLDEQACTRSITHAGPLSDPNETLEQIIEAWWDLEVEEQDHSWTLTAVNRARTWSPNKDLLHPVYILTRKGDPFHLSGVTAVALPKWINNYHCLGLLKNACGPILDHCCAMWCVTLDSEKSLLSATLVPSFKCTLKPFSVTLFALTCKQPYNDPSVPCTCLLRGSKITR